MTLSNLLSTISAIDDISIHNGQGEVVFNGMCGDYRATSNEDIVNRYANVSVDRVRAYNDVIVILLCEE